MASREQYQVPTASGGQGAGAAKTFTSDVHTPGQPMHYLCGDCGIKNSLHRADPIRCHDCGCRVLYKERTKRMVQFEAR